MRFVGSSKLGVKLGDTDILVWTRRRVKVIHPSVITPSITVVGVMVCPLVGLGSRLVRVGLCVGCLSIVRIRFLPAF